MPNSSSSNKDSDRRYSSRRKSSDDEYCLFFFTFAFFFFSFLLFLEFLSNRFIAILRFVEEFESPDICIQQFWRIQFNVKQRQEIGVVQHVVLFEHYILSWCELLPLFSPFFFRLINEQFLSLKIKVPLKTCGDWSEFMSSAGKVYYYNSRTERTQWEKPPDWDWMLMQQEKFAKNDYRDYMYSNSKSRYSRNNKYENETSRHYADSKAYHRGNWLRSFHRSMCFIIYFSIPSNERLSEWLHESDDELTTIIVKLAIQPIIHS